MISYHVILCLRPTHNVRIWKLAISTQAGAHFIEVDSPPDKGNHEIPRPRILRCVDSYLIETTQRPGYV